MWPSASVSLRSRLTPIMCAGGGWQRGWRAPRWPRRTLGTNTIDYAARLVRRRCMRPERSVWGPSASHSQPTFIGSLLERTANARRSSRSPSGQSSLLFRRFSQHLPWRPCWPAFGRARSRATLWCHEGSALPRARARCDAEFQRRGDRTDVPHWSHHHGAARRRLRVAEVFAERTSARRLAGAGRLRRREYPDLDPRHADRKSTRLTP